MFSRHGWTEGLREREIERETDGESEFCVYVSLQWTLQIHI